jgi:hypothetical protein
VLLCPFQDQRHCASRQFSPDDLECLDGDQGLEFSIQRVKMGRSAVGEVHLDEDSVKPAYGGHSASSISSGSVRAIEYLNDPLRLSWVE